MVQMNGFGFDCGGRCNLPWHDEFFDIPEYAAPETVFGEVAKETLYSVEPRTAGGSEVYVKVRRFVSAYPKIGGLTFTSRERRGKPMLVTYPSCG